MTRTILCFGLVLSLLGCRQEESESSTPAPVETAPEKKVPAEIVTNDGGENPEPVEPAPAPEPAPVPAEPAAELPPLPDELDFDDDNVIYQVMLRAKPMESLTVQGTAGNDMLVDAETGDLYSGWVSEKHSNGPIAYLQQYKNGRREGLVVSWGPDGKKAKEVHYRYNILHGPWIEYRNGVKTLEGGYADGRQDGVWTYYDAEGNVTKTENWADGQPAGEGTTP